MTERVLAEFRAGHAGRQPPRDQRLHPRRDLADPRQRSSSGWPSWASRPARCSPSPRPPACCRPPAGRYSRGQRPAAVRRPAAGPRRRPHATGSRHSPQPLRNGFRRPRRARAAPPPRQASARPASSGRSRTPAAGRRPPGRARRRPARAGQAPAALPLSALLSQALVAFTIEADNETEHRLPHRTQDYGLAPGAPPGAPWLTSLLMYANCLRHLPDAGITIAELRQPGKDRHEPRRHAPLALRHVHPRPRPRQAPSGRTR